MVETLFLIIFFFIIHGQIETVHVCKRATCIYPFHEISCNFGSGEFLTPPPTSQTVKKKFFFPSFFMDLSISWNFLQFWFRCIFNPPPTPTHWPNSEKKFLDGFIHFMKFLAYDDYCVPICWDLGSTRYHTVTIVESFQYIIWVY